MSLKCVVFHFYWFQSTYNDVNICLVEAITSRNKTLPVQGNHDIISAYKENLCLNIKISSIN
jgi:hypothetical protein